MPRGSARDPVALANELRPVLLRIARKLRRESEAFGVTATQVTLLASIRERPGTGVGELAEAEGVSPPNVSVHVQRLEREGLVERRPATDDARRHGLFATPDGMRVLQSVRSGRTAWLATRLRRADDADFDALKAAIGPLTELLDELE
jgi:DNA-binding MarR family transcriptional regulator